MQDTPSLHKLRLLLWLRLAACQIEQPRLVLCTANEIEEKVWKHYRAVVVTVTVSVTVAGPTRPGETNVMLEPVAVGADVDAGSGITATGVVESAEFMVGRPGDDNVSLGNEMTTGVCDDVVDGT